MQSVDVDDLTLLLETAEGGTRYHAPILIIPGLFHSEACWRGMMSMLAHRGWDVYLLPRQVEGQEKDPFEMGWEAALDGVARAAAHLGDKLVVFGADVGASMALAAVDRIEPLALGLFAPVEPAALGESITKSFGFLGQRRIKKRSGPVAPPSAVAKRRHRPTDVASEPRGLVGDLMRGVRFERPRAHPPAIVFAPENDPLVDAHHALAFAETDYSKVSPTRLSGRWWPSLGWENACDAAHRFLILTLSDRVVEFPDEVINE